MDFKFLNDLAPVDVRVEILTDPFFHHDKTRYHLNGKLLPIHPLDTTSKYGISVVPKTKLPKYSSGEVHYMRESNLAAWLPSNATEPICPNILLYLGSARTIWTIERLKDHKKLFYHEPTSDNKFLIKGPGSQNLGTLTGLTLPYQIPDNCWTKNRVALKTQEFEQWRKTILEPL
jgi:hypothetical protein